jgi:uncharacterized zinc-type alcohol dehydrogenase-like protein
MTIVKAYAAHAAGEPLQPYEFELGTLGADEVDVDVRSCGICHSDLSMLDNEWQMSTYPLVPGHEIVGTVAAVGAAVPNLRPGDSVGVGWFSRSCLHCPPCFAGDHNLCASGEGVIVGRHGGFATRIRAQWLWVVPLPAGLDPATTGPLFCGGITVFNPVVQYGIRATDHVAVVGIGGLGHLALQFLRAWGCRVTALSTSADKEAEARRLGATDFVVARDADDVAALAGCFDMILVTVNVPLPWDAYVAALKPRGRLHIVGAAPSVTAAVFPLILGQRSIAGSPVGSRGMLATMLEFAARHGIAPITETFPLSRVNDALDRLRAGKARYRLVLENDLA